MSGRRPASSAPATLEEFNTDVATLASKNPRGIKNFSGFFLGGQDWRNGISWIFANGGDLAKKENGQWVSTLSDAGSMKGLHAAARSHLQERLQGTGGREGRHPLAVRQRQ